eukprot:TRINITY_DN95722_c0_g1_i1.p1 TRINITY_DN95722_c0_g1~~TRINITY_DN95722_c0_g1_i1.p1  ORF type:complete len:458 (-),score=94.34 TRINITY_DN95722_c0_g1_i1:70-1443(-)
MTTQNSSSMRSLATRIGKELWTEGEGKALTALNHELQSVLSFLESGDRSTVLFLHAALGPSWWMIGAASDGYKLASEFLGPLDEATTLADGEAPEGLPSGEVSLKVEKLQKAASQPNAFQDGPFLEGISDSLLRGCALDAAGMNAYAISSYKDAWKLHAAAYVLAACGTGSDSVVLKSRALDGLGRVCRETGRYDLAWLFHVAAFDIALAAHDGDAKPPLLRPVLLTCAANAVSNAGVVAYRRKQLTLAHSLHVSALHVRERSGDMRGLSSSQGNLALLLSATEALPLYQKSMSIREELGDFWGVAGSLRALAEVHRKLGDPSSAKSCTAKAVTRFAEANDRLGAAECLETLGLLTIKHEGASAVAATLLGAAIALRRAIGAAEDVVMHHSEVAELQKTDADAWARGVVMSLSDATAFLDEHVSGSIDTKVLSKKRPRENEAEWICASSLRPDAVSS